MTLTKRPSQGAGSGHSCDRQTRWCGGPGQGDDGDFALHVLVQLHVHCSLVTCRGIARRHYSPGTACARTVSAVSDPGSFTVIAVAPAGLAAGHGHDGSPYTRARLDLAGRRVKQSTQGRTSPPSCAHHGTLIQCSRTAHSPPARISKTAATALPRGDCGAVPVLIPIPAAGQRVGDTRTLKSSMGRSALAREVGSPSDCVRSVCLVILLIDVPIR